ncbi:T9SS type A sorting domain-containing protein [Flaviaesturariibacter amylovorans]|uniref:T9SS type A sorting domain-containing protein n=1 Tax=Flaviaesturariibacter amylovorans TaxID=1084520 RepID=A0ABP8GYT0_9BACT
MRSLLTILMLHLASSLSAQPPVWQWAARGGSPTNSANPFQEEVVEMRTDKAGNVYLLCRVATVQPLTLSGVPGSVTGYGQSDILLLSYRKDGAFRWKKLIGGYWEERPRALDLDTVGNIYIAGNVAPPHPVNNPGETLVHYDTDSIQPVGSAKRVFIAQYDTSGTFRWLRQLAPDTASELTNSRYKIYDLIARPGGGVDVLCFLAAGPVYNGPTADSARTFVLTYDAQGNATALLKPQITMDVLTGSNLATSLVYFNVLRTRTGRFVVSGSQTFNTQPPYNDTLDFAGEPVRTSLFIGCFDEQWRLLWKKGNVIASGIIGQPAEDAAGNLYFAGGGWPGDVAAGFPVLNSQGNHSTPLLLKLNAAGNLLWGRTAGTNASTNAVAVAVQNNKVYLAGAYPGLLDFGGMSLENPPNSLYDMFLATFDAGTGNILRPDSLDSTPGTNDRATALALSPGGQLYLAGHFAGDLQAGNTPIVAAGGLSDFFVVRTEVGNVATSATTPEALPEPILFPNPAASYVTVRPASGAATWIAVRLYTLSGQLLASATGYRAVRLPVAAYPAGAYVVAVEDLRRRLVQRRILLRQ